MSRNGSGKMTTIKKANARNPLTHHGAFHSDFFMRRLNEYPGINQILRQIYRDVQTIDRT